MTYMINDGCWLYLCLVHAMRIRLEETSISRARNDSFWLEDSEQHQSHTNITIYFEISSFDIYKMKASYSFVQFGSLAFSVLHGRQLMLLHGRHQQFFVNSKYDFTKYH